MCDIHIYISGSYDMHVINAFHLNCSTHTLNFCSPRDVGSEGNNRSGSDNWKSTRLIISIQIQNKNRSDGWIEPILI